MEGIFLMLSLSNRCNSVFLSCAFLIISVQIVEEAFGELSYIKRAVFKTEFRALNVFAFSLKTQPLSVIFTEHTYLQIVVSKLQLHEFLYATNGQRPSNC